MGVPVPVPEIEGVGVLDRLVLLVGEFDGLFGPVLGVTDADGVILAVGELEGVLDALLVEVELGEAAAAGAT